MTWTELLTAVDPRGTAEFRALAAAFDRVDLPGAIAAEPTAIARYARCWEQATVQLCGMGGVGSPLREVLLQESMNAPWTPWVVRGSAGGGKTGLALALLARFRGLIGSPDAEPLYPPLPIAVYQSRLEHWPVRTPAFARAVFLAITAPEPLGGHIINTLQLSGVEYARLFGVTRQAAAQWGPDVPPVHQAKALVIAEIADLLARNLKPERLPAVVRRAAENYGGRSILDVIADGDHEWLLADLQRRFDYAASA